jgi:hypothetical protein
MNNPSGRTAPCASGEQRVVEARRPRGQYIYQPTSRRSAPRWPSTPPPEQQCARWLRCRGARTCPVSPCTARTRSAGPRIHEEDAPGAAAETEAAHGRVERHTVGSVEVHRGSVPPARCQVAIGQHRPPGGVSSIGRDDQLRRQHLHRRHGLLIKLYIYKSTTHIYKSQH